MLQTRTVTYVNLTNISFGYQEKLVLENLTLRFQKNQVTTIVGRSGSGKSTILQLINGLLKPHSGEVLVDGTPLNYANLSPQRLCIGYLVQGNGLFPHMTVSENIGITGKITRHNATLDRIQELMELTGLRVNLAQRYPHEISGGEQQRVAICRALYLDPPLLLVDEPFGALDPISRHEMRLKLLELQRIKPRTIIMVTHDMHEAKILGEQLVVIDQGKVIQSGTRNEVFEHPAHDIVRQLIDAG